MAELVSGLHHAEFYLLKSALKGQRFSFFFTLAILMREIKAVVCVCVNLQWNWREGPRKNTALTITGGERQDTPEAHDNGVILRRYVARLVVTEPLTSVVGCGDLCVTDFRLR